MAINIYQSIVQPRYATYMEFSTDHIN